MFSSLPLLPANAVGAMVAASAAEKIPGYRMLQKSTMRYRLITTFFQQQGWVVHFKFAVFVELLRAHEPLASPLYLWISYVGVMREGLTIAHVRKREWKTTQRPLFGLAATAASKSTRRVAKP